MRPFTLLFPALLLTACTWTARPTARVTAPLPPTNGVIVGPGYGAALTVGEHGQIRVAGRSFLPVGFYYLPYRAPAATVAKDLKTIKADGFNMVHFDMDGGSPEYMRWLTGNLLPLAASDAPADGGHPLYMIFGGLFGESPVPCAQSGSGFTKVDARGMAYLRSYQSWASLFGFKLSDDAYTDQAATSRCSAQELRARAMLLKHYIDDVPDADGDQQDKKLVSITGSTAWVPYSDRVSQRARFQAIWAHLSASFATANVIGVQAFSGLNGGQSSVVYASVKQASEVAESGEDLSGYTAAQLQNITPLHGLGGHSVWAENMVVNSGVGTTPPKVYVEAWAALAAGAKGLLWYAYRDTDGSYLPDSFYAQTKNVLADLQLPNSGTTVASVILDGDRQSAVHASGEVFGTSWVMPNGRTYLLAVNTGAGAVTGAASTLSFMVDGQTLLPFNAGSTRLNHPGYGIAGHQNGGVVLRGTLPAYSASLFELR